MSDPIYVNTSLANAFKNAGLDINDEADVALFQEVAQKMGAGRTVSSVAKIAQDYRNRDGVGILDQYNREHPLGVTSIATPPQKDPKDMSGFEQIDAWNESHPL